jgi:multidrug resistance efflux pump
MLELLLCSSITILPDYLYRRYVQGKRFGKEINLSSVWYELRWGITLCLILTVSLITTIFYFHPSTKSATSVFRTVTILPETSGRVAETYVGINEIVEEGQPLFKLDDTEQRAAVETATRVIAETEARLKIAEANPRESEGRIAQAEGSLAQANDEYQTRLELLNRGSGTVSEREVQRALVQVNTQ